MNKMLEDYAKNYAEDYAKEREKRGREEGEVIGFIRMGKKMKLTALDIIHFIADETGVSEEEAKRLYEKCKSK